MAGNAGTCQPDTDWRRPDARYMHSYMTQARPCARRRTHPFDSWVRPRRRLPPARASTLYWPHNKAATLRSQHGGGSTNAVTHNTNPQYQGW